MVGRSTPAPLSLFARVFLLRVVENDTKVILNRGTEWKVVGSQSITFCILKTRTVVVVAVVVVAVVVVVVYFLPRRTP